MTHEANVFMDGAPILSGTWYNTKTGDSFTVRDTYFEDNNLFVLATDGRRFDYNMLQNYVQSDKPLAKEQPASKASVIPKEVASIIEQQVDDDGILPEDLALINKTTVKPIVEKTKIAQPTAQPAIIDDEDTMLIRRLLSRGSKPSVNVSIRWDKFPYKQMEMLDMMGVEFDKIVDYYIKTAIDIDSLRDDIARKISNYLEKIINGDIEDKDASKAEQVQTTVLPETAVKEEKPVVKKTVKTTVKKTTTKKTTKK